MCNNSSRKLVTIVTSAILRRNNRIANVRTRVFISGNITRGGLARLAVIPGVARQHAHVVRLNSIFVTFPNNAKALRRVDRIISGIYLSRLARPYVFCGLGNFCSSVGTLLRHVVSSNFSAQRHRRNVCFTSSLTRVRRVVTVRGT